jgi:hypothetical protein
MNDQTSTIIIGIIYLAVIVLTVAGMWKVFTKAGQPGWAAIVPIVNLYFLCKVAGRPGWWVLLCLIPFINWIFLIIIANDVSKSFGGGIGTTLGLIFLPFIFYPVLGFGEAQYQGPAAAT